MRLQCGKAELQAQRGGLLEGKGPRAEANSGSPFTLATFPGTNTRLRVFISESKYTCPKAFKEFQLPINGVRLQLQPHACYRCN